MNRTCPVVIECPCIDSPILNISAEAPDPLIFVGWGYTPYDPYRPPPIGQNKEYTAYDCDGIAFSVASQEIADLLAQMNASFCQQSNQFDGNASALGMFYTNNEQTAYKFCGSTAPGTSITTWYTVPAGTYVSPMLNAEAGLEWQAAADAQALAFAQQQIAKSTNSACMDCAHFSALRNGGCVDEPIDSAQNTYTITGPQSSANFAFTISAGALPPGVTLVKISNNQAKLTGTPFTIGVYNFTVRATVINGLVSVSVDDRFYVMGITNPYLSDATVGTPYSDQLVASGGIPPYVFTAVDPLPDGLTLAPDGTISGTPTTPDPP